MKSGVCRHDWDRLELFSKPFSYRNLGKKRTGIDKEWFLH
jgi:hypothetical protein